MSLAPSNHSMDGPTLAHRAAWPAALAISPLLYAQGKWVRKQVPKLPHAPQPWEGEVAGPSPISVLGIGDSTIAGVGVGNPLAHRRLTGIFRTLPTHRSQTRLLLGFWASLRQSQVDEALMPDYSRTLLAGKAGAVPEPRDGHQAPTAEDNANEPPARRFFVPAKTCLLSHTLAPMISKRYTDREEYRL